MHHDLCVMTGLYSSARRKWEWAEQHRSALETDFVRLQDFKGDSTGLQFDHDDAEDQITNSMKLMTITVRFGETVPTLSEGFPNILGDAIHNYRSALDHAAWEMVHRFGAKISAGDARKVQFPMHNSAKDFAKWQGRRTPGVPDKPHRAFLKRYQPYRHGDGPKAIRWLRRLSDHDKHRELIPAVVAPKGVLIAAQALMPEIQLLRYRALLTRPSQIEPGTPIVELDLAVPLSLVGSQIQVAVNTQSELFPRLSPSGQPRSPAAAN
jgi:hypothetical protein